MQADIKQAGFTLIELVIVIVILGILATVAIPAYVDMRQQAWDANTAGVGAAISSGSAVNYAACSAGAACVTVAKCSDAAGLLASGATSGLPNGAPSGMTYAWDADTAVSGGKAICKLQLKSGATVKSTNTFTIIGAP